MRWPGASVAPSGSMGATTKRPSRATIALARLLRARQPRLWDFCLKLRRKEAVLDEIGTPLHLEKAAPGEVDAELLTALGFVRGAEHLLFTSQAQAA